MLEVWHIWVIAGLVLWIVEIFTPEFVAGVFGAACLIAAPFAAAGLSFKIQLFVFGVATAVMSLGIRPLILKNFYRAQAKIKTNVDALVGQAGLVVEAIDPAAGTGRAKIGGETWRAVTRDETQVKVGEKVTVVAVEGCTVVVHAAPQTERK